MTGDAFVPLCTCHDSMSAQAVRAALEARGLEVIIQGGHSRDVLGGVYGAMIQPRILVRPDDLALAAELAEDVMGELGHARDHGDDHRRVDHPMRPVPSEAALDELGADAPPTWEDGEAEDDLDEDDLDEAALDEDANGELEATADARRSGLAARPRTVAIPILLGFLGLSIGFAHIYAGKPNLGAALLVATGVGVLLGVIGQPVGFVVVAGVWLFDLVGALITVVARNRAARDVDQPPSPA